MSTDLQADSPLQYIASRIPMTRVTAPQFVATVLREAIVTGAISGLAPLRQELIAKDLNTSKVPVREALRELEGQGLVQFVPNRGFMVKPPSINEMLECFELRTVLEPLAVRHSVPLATPAHLDAVERIIDEFELVRDPILISQWNLTLHIALYAPAQMSHLENMIVRAHTIAQRYTHIYMRLRSAEIDSQDEHRAILAAYRGKDIELAVALMTVHIAKASNEAARYLKDHFVKK
jgi:DNA-binding GntR family transcriptional regulator